MSVITDIIKAGLHDEKHQPDTKNGRLIVMPLDQLTEEAFEALAAGQEQIPAGTVEGWFDAFEPQQQEKFQDMVQITGGGKT